MDDITITIHIVSTNERIEYGGSVITDCNRKLLYTKPSAWPKRGLCQQCLPEFVKRKTEHAYTVTEVKHPAAQEAPET